MQQKKLDFVDALRGIAVLMVIAIHTAHKVPDLGFVFDVFSKYGQMGVQLFFVVSAYTLCVSHERRRDEKKPVLSYFVRRYFRIAPLYYFAIPVYLVFGVMVQIIRGVSDITIEPYSFKNVIANLLFIHGFVPSANNNIVPGGWSIGTEMAFYVVFPLLFNFVRGLVAKGVYRLVIFICCIVLFNFSSQMFFLVDTQFEISNNSFVYFNLMNQLPVFLVGFVAFYVANPNEKLAPTHVSILFFLLFTAASLFFWKQKNPLYFALIPTVSAFSFLFLLNALRGVCFGKSIILRIGQVSFSMYIFHYLLTWGLLPFLVAQFKNALAPELLLIICFFIVCALTYAIAVLTQNKIELRGIEFGNTIIRRFKSV